MIREYRNQDAGQLQECLIALQDAMHDLESEILPPGEDIKETYGDYLHSMVAKQDGVIFVVEIERQVVGYLCAWTECPADEAQPFLYIQDIAMMPSFRGQGWGTKLLLQAEQFAHRKNLDAMRIGALCNNIGAINLYRRVGYRDFALWLTKRV